VTDPLGNLVGPYSIAVDGYPTTADCYDYLGRVEYGVPFTANEYDYTQAVAMGMFAGDALGYQMVAALYALPYTDLAGQIAEQDAIWDVFRPGSVAQTPGMVAYAGSAAALIPSFDFSGTAFLEPLDHNFQAFVVHVTPEPISLALIGAGLILFGYRARRSGQKEK